VAPRRLYEDLRGAMLLVVQVWFRNRPPWPSDPGSSLGRMARVEQSVFSRRHTENLALGKSIENGERPWQVFDRLVFHGRKLSVVRRWCQLFLTRPCGGVVWIFSINRCVFCQLPRMTDVDCHLAFIALVGWLSGDLG